MQPICADLPTAAIKNKQESTTKILQLVLSNQDTFDNIVGKFKELAKYNVRPLAAIKLTSPTLLTIIAFNAALLAWRRVNQKFINKYETKPTPSQPKK